MYLKQIVDYTSVFEYKDLRSHGSIIKAAYKGDLPLLKQLVGKGLAVNANENRGYTALHIAVMREQ